MWADPIVEEIHAIRKQLANECEDDLNKIVRRAILRQSLRASHLKEPSMQPFMPPTGLNNLIHPAI